MAYQYIGKDIYKQLEQVMLKLDNAQNEIKELTQVIKNLNKTIEEKNIENQKLLNEIDRLKNQKNKNSSNSSKPSSTNYRTPKKKTGANLYNYRVKTGKSIGGQFGHTGHNLGKKQIDELIKNKKIEVRTFTHKIKGDNKTADIVKYKLGIEVKPYVEKHIFKYDKKSKEVLPYEFYTDVTYDNSIKSLSIDLSVLNVVSYDRLSDFFRVITNDIFNISNGTLVNFLYEFGRKSEETITNIKNNILNGKTTYTDETGAKFNKKNIYVRNYSNEFNVLYTGHKNKGHKPILEDNILPIFCGGIMGDHDTTLQSYGAKNYECNIHVGRYLEELIQNVPELLWCKKMKELIFRINNTRKIAISYGLTKFDKLKIKEYEEEYNNILKLAKEENKNIKSSYYKDKANKLYRRMKKYKRNHLYFIKNFEVPFDNNLSESDLRVFKIKTKVSGGFRSIKGIENYLKCLSIIKTSIKRKINPYESIKAIFNNEILFAN